jgi:hypothetical protein
MKIVQAPCSSCVRQTNHKVLFETNQRGEDLIDTYLLLECSGCSTISMCHHCRWIADGSTELKYYPSPVSRKKPNWFWRRALSKEGAHLGELLTEIYQAVDGGQNRLAGMGIRALLEQIMILKVGDLPTFDRKLDKFQEQGYISQIQRDAMRATLNVGDAAMHRGFKPTDQDLNVVLDIVEGVLSPILGHKGTVKKLADRVPPRAPKSPKK